MMTSLLFALAAAAAEPAALPVAPAPLLQNPRTMSQSEIRAYNTGREKSDPDFIRCVKREETGSLARKTFSCHTNAQWAQADRVGNQNARDTYEAMTSKATNTSN
jgi:hypothetical protein